MLIGDKALIIIGAANIGLALAPINWWGLLIGAICSILGFYENGDHE